MDSKEPEELSELEIAKKDWRRLAEIASKTGYREGIEDGSESVFQEGFDKGYEDAFETAFLLGKFKSLLNKTTECPEDIKEVLSKTRRGACHICKLESEKQDVESIPFSELVLRQRKYSQEVIRKLQDYFQPIVHSIGMNIYKE